MPVERVLEDPYPFKLLRVKEGKLIVVDTSKTPDRLVTLLNAYKARGESKPGNRLVLVKVCYKVLDQ